MFFDELVLNLFVISVSVVPVLAVILRVVAKWVADVEVPFARAYVTELLLAVVLSPISVSPALQLILANDQFGLTRLVWPLAFLLHVLLVSRRINIRFGQACGVTLVMMLVMIGIDLVVVCYLSW